MYYSEYTYSPLFSSMICFVLYMSGNVNTYNNNGHFYTFYPIQELITIAIC